MDGKLLSDFNGGITTMSNPKVIFEKVERRINERQVDLTKIGAVYKFVVTGPDGGIWVIDLREDTFGVREGEEEANCTFQTEETYFMDLFTGKLPPESALLTGKVKVSGDVMLAMKFGQLLKK